MKDSLFLSKLFFAFAVSSNLALASTQHLENFYKLFKNGQYPKAIEALNQLSLEENSLSSKSYLEGICYSRLQEYDKAIIQFEIAIKENNESQDLFYEYGQALYAANELKKARVAFIKSIDKKFNIPASRYYIAHISQILEEFQTAKEQYSLLIKDSNSDSKMKQIARYQLSEVLLLILREKNKAQSELEQNVAKFILPLMKQAYETDKSTTLAGEIDTRYKELQKEFNLDPDLLSNGRRINPKRFSASFAQKFKFDDNISLTNEENNTTASKKESFIFESELYSKYDFLLKKKFIISPEIRYTFIHHGDQDNSEVYQNDSYIVNTNLKNKYEHKLFNQPASFNFDLDYSMTFKDYEKTHTRKHYADAFTFGIGESFSYFTFGDTSLKFKYKNYMAEEENSKNHTTTFSLDQSFALPTRHLLIALFELDKTDNYNNSSTNTDSYLLRFDYIIPEIFPRYTLSFGLATTLTNPLEQRNTRGYETSINPSIDLSKQISENFKFALNYDYTNSKSKSSDYNYLKNVFSLEIKYNF